MMNEGKYTISGDSIVNRATGEAIPDDEPVFLLRARDLQAVHAINQYRYACSVTGSPKAHLDGVQTAENAFIDFNRAFPSRMKQPGTA